MIKYLIISCLLLAGCGSKEVSNEKVNGFTPVSERKRIEYSPSQTVKLELGPFSGAVTENTASFVVKTEAAADVQIECSEKQDFSEPLYSDKFKAVKENYFYVKPIVKGLSPDTKYFYRTIINGFPNERVHYLFTFPSNKERSFSFGFGSCMRPGPNSNPAIYPVIGKDSLKFFMNIGDWTYPDNSVSRDFYTDMGKLEQSYQQKYNYSYPFASDVLSKMSVSYMYDDHDFVGNDKGGDIPGKENSIKAYRNFFPHYDLPNADNGIWQSFKYGDVEFFMIDVRAQRSNNSDILNSGSLDETAIHSILAGYEINGENQKEWLFRSIKESKAKWKVLVSPVIFNPKYIDALRDSKIVQSAPQVARGLLDKWAGYPKDVNDLMAAIKDNDIKNVIMLSGDSHSSYIDDGANSFIPEISASNLDVNNSNIGLLLMLAGYNIWNKGSYLDNGRVYGRVSFVYEGSDHALLELVNEKNEIIASHKLDAQ